MKTNTRSLRVYVYAGCDTCRKALRFLQDAGVPHEVVPIREKPPTLVELKRVLKATGGEVRRLFNTSGQDYRAMGLGVRLPELTVDQALALLAVNGNLVKRPFVVTSDGGWVGFKADEWKTRTTRSSTLSRTVEGVRSRND